MARLLAHQRYTLRLVLLNACEGARGGGLDLFAGTAATLVGSGIPAVLAMQYEITDDAAIDFARTFYEALADNLPVDSAVADARNAMILRNRFSLEWGTPVLYLRAPDGRLFAVAETGPVTVPVTVVTTPVATPPTPVLTTPPASDPTPDQEQPNLRTFVRDMLAGLYAEETDARRIVADAGLSAERLAAKGKALNTWHAIVGEAEKTGQMKALLAVALKEYGSNPTLRMLAGAYGVPLLADTDVAAPPAPPSTAPRRSATVAPKPPIDFDWVTIPVGKFWMGSDKANDNLAFNDELSQHEVNLPAYRITRYPVTNAEYKRFVDAKGYQPPSHWKDRQIPGGKENHPVVHVSWEDAMAFCDWAGVQLPSEAEWEKAARGTDGLIYPWGNEAPDKTRCNFNMFVGDATSVDNYSTGKSPYGVWEMAGNVWEWTTSLFKSYPYDPKDGREDPAAAGHRVVRGGSFGHNRRRVRAASRNYFNIDNRFIDVGFCVVVPGS